MRSLISRLLFCTPRPVLPPSVRVGAVLHSLALHSVPERANAVLTYWLGSDYACPQPDTFWAAPEQSKLWFRGGPEVDQYITQHFSSDLKALAAGEYEGWLQQPLSALAGIILADQFTRNVYRGTADAFSLDSKALQWSAHVRGLSDFHAALPSPVLRYFAYMPLMHSERLQEQELLVQLVKSEQEASKQQDPESPAAKSWLDILSYAEAHRDVVARWGRFPHRNAVLGRQNTPEEEAGLQAGTIPRW